MALDITIYLIGCVIAYILIISIIQNTQLSAEEDKPSKLLVFTTSIVYVLSSWITVILFGLISILDSDFRKICFVPLHWKLSKNE